MKQKLWKSRKPYSRFKVVLYSSEDGRNTGCTYNDDCNMGDRTLDGVNIRCSPPKSTQAGARNVLCNLTVNC
jgi:hypothetical protein